MIKYNQNLSQIWGLKLLDHKTVSKEAHLSSRESWDCFLAIIQHFMRNPDPMVVPIYSIEALQIPQDPTTMYSDFIYRYTMKRLGMLSYGEKALILSMKELRIADRIGSTALFIKKHQDNFQLYKDEYPELVNFMKKILDQKRYLDVHAGNFLKDEDDSYKIIDLEGFINAPLDREENNWITR